MENFSALEMIAKNNCEAMSYNNLLNMQNECYKAIGQIQVEINKINSIMKTKRVEEMTAITRGFIYSMGAYGATMDEIMNYISKESTMKMPVSGENEDVENNLDNDTTTLALPEPTTKEEEPAPMEKTVEEPKNNAPILPEPKEESIKSVFDDPAFNAPYDPITAKKDAAATMPAPNEETMPTMEELCSVDSIYKEHYGSKPTPKKKHTLPTMEKLCSGEPIDQIISMGDVKSKFDYHQWTGISYAGGIIPTETAMGRTLVYIPKT